MNKTTTQPRVAFQGELGAFSAEAAVKLLGDPVDLLPCQTFEEAFAALATDKAGYAVVPIENSLFGAVYQNYDLLLHQPCTIIAETYLRIVHNLIALPGVSLKQIKTVYSHPVALAQCSRFLAAQPRLQPAVSYDTAGSVKQLVANQSQEAAAIAGAGAATIYGAQILAAGIEDDQQNFTRFLLLTSASLAPPEDADKISIVFTLENDTGSLHRALAVFALRQIDLTKIESRPLIGRPWEYHFYLDFLGHLHEPRIQYALQNLQEFATHVKILGCYRRV